MKEKMLREQFSNLNMLLKNKNKQFKAKMN